MLRLLSIALNLTCAGLFYKLIERRVGGWIALAAASLLIVFGAAADVVATSLGIAIMIGVACGLGALLALERDDGRGDRIACLLLIGGLFSNSVAIPFAVAAAIEVAVSGRSWRNRWWVVGIPLLAYALARLWSLHLDPLGPLAAHPTEITLSNVAGLPTSIADSLADAALSITGIYTQPGVAARTFSTDFGPPLAVALVALLVLRVRNGPPLDRRVLVYAALPLTYWALIALVASDRTPSVSRYQFAGAIFLLLLCAELARGIRIPARAQAVVVALLVIGAAPNAYNLHESSNLLRSNAKIDRAELAAIELSADRVPDDLLVEPIGGRYDPGSPALYTGGEPSPTTDAVISAGRYLSAARSVRLGRLQRSRAPREPGVRARSGRQGASGDRRAAAWAADGGAWELQAAGDNLPRGARAAAAARGHRDPGRRRRHGRRQPEAVRRQLFDSGGRCPRGVDDGRPAAARRLAATVVGAGFAQRRSRGVSGPMIAKDDPEPAGRWRRRWPLPRRRCCG